MRYISSIYTKWEKIMIVFFSPYIWRPEKLFYSILTIFLLILFQVNWYYLYHQILQVFWNNKLFSISSISNRIFLSSAQRFSEILLKKRKKKKFGVSIVIGWKPKPELPLFIGGKVSVFARDNEFEANLMDLSWISGTNVADCTVWMTVILRRWINMSERLHEWEWRETVDCSINVQTRYTIILY